MIARMTMKLSQEVEIMRYSLLRLFLMVGTPSVGRLTKGEQEARTYRGGSLVKSQSPS